MVTAEDMTLSTLVACTLETIDIRCLDQGLQKVAPTANAAISAELAAEEGNLDNLELIAEFGNPVISDKILLNAVIFACLKDQGKGLEMLDFLYRQQSHNWIIWSKEGGHQAYFGEEKCIRTRLPVLRRRLLLLGCS